MDYRTPNIYDPSTLTEPYAYARANPTMFWDPNGLKEISYRIGNTNYILDIDDETWSAILHGELTFAGITLFDPLAPVTPQWVMHHSVGEDFPDMEMTNREEVWHYQKELMSREAKQLAFIQKFMPRHTNTVFPWILKDVLKSLNESDAQGRGAIYRALYQAGMLHQVNVANGFGRDFAQEAALALVGPQITHYKRFGFWQDLEVAGWVVTAGDAGWILKGLIRPNKSLLTRSFDDLLPVAPNTARGKYSGLTDEQFAQEIARRAEKKVGGTGAAAGSRKHSYAERLMKRYQDFTGQRRHLQVERSYLNGKPVSRGTAGSARPDLYDPITGNVYDYKFTTRPGRGISPRQQTHNANNLPIVGQQVEINP